MIFLKITTETCSQFSLHRKSARFLHGLTQLVVKQLEAVVSRQVDSIKACVSLGQVLNGNVAGQMDGEEPWRCCAGVSLKRLESLQGNAR